MSDLHKRSVEARRTEQVRLEAVSRWRVLAPLEVSLDRRFMVPGNHEIDRKARAAVLMWVWSGIAKGPRACSK